MLVLIVKFDLKVQISWMPGFCPLEKLYNSHVEKDYCLVYPPEKIHNIHEGIRQYDSCDTGHSDNANIAAEHQEPAEVLSQLGDMSNPPVYGEYKCC